MTRLWTVLVLFGALLIAPQVSFAATNGCIPTAPPASYNLNSFYKKFCLVEGIPLVSSAAVSDTALQEAAGMMKGMLAGRSDIARALVRNNVKVAIIGANEQTTDIPEYRSLPTLFPGTDWNARTRGVGATVAIPVSSVGEENLLCSTADRYRGQSIFVHEFGHTLKDLGVEYIDSTFSGRLDRAFANAKTKNFWTNTYAGSNVEEYWATGVQAYFDSAGTAIPSNGIYNHVNTRDELRIYDPELYALVEEVFDTSWKWQCPGTTPPAPESEVRIQVKVPNGGETYTSGSREKIRVTWTAENLTRAGRVCVAFVSATSTATSYPLQTSTGNGCTTARDGTRTLQGRLKEGMPSGSYFIRVSAYDTRTGGTVIATDDSDTVVRITNQNDVPPPVPPSREPVVSCVATANKTSIIQQNTVTVSWIARNASYGTGPFGDKIGTTGSMIYVPQLTTTYGFTFYGQTGGKAGCSVTVEVSIPDESDTQPNLVAQTVTSEGTATVGSTVPLYASIQNTGEGSAVGTFINTFGLDDNADHGSIYSTINVPMATLAAGKSRTSATSVEFPSTGTWYVRACADSDSQYVGTIAETSETDNCGPWSSVRVTPARKSLNLEASAGSASSAVLTDLARQIESLLAETKRLLPQ